MTPARPSASPCYRDRGTAKVIKPAVNPASLRGMYRFKDRIAVHSAINSDARSTDAAQRPRAARPRRPAKSTDTIAHSFHCSASRRLKGRTDAHRAINRGDGPIEVRANAPLHSPQASQAGRYNRPPHSTHRSFARRAAIRRIAPPRRPLNSHPAMNHADTR